jgi:hypothetical protein
LLDDLKRVASRHDAHLQPPRLHRDSHEARAGETYRYPRGILELTIQAMNADGVASAKAVFRRTSAEEREHPERYFINRNGILGCRCVDE